MLDEKSIVTMNIRKGRSFNMEKIFLCQYLPLKNKTILVNKKISI